MLDITKWSATKEQLSRMKKIPQPRNLNIHVVDNPKISIELEFGAKFFSCLDHFVNFMNNLLLINRKLDLDHIEDIHITDSKFYVACHPNIARSINNIMQKGMQYFKCAPISHIRTSKSLDSIFSNTCQYQLKNFVQGKWADAKDLFTFVISSQKPISWDVFKALATSEYSEILCLKGINGISKPCCVEVNVDDLLYDQSSADIYLKKLAGTKVIAKRRTEISQMEKQYGFIVIEPEIENKQPSKLPLWAGLAVSILILGHFIYSYQLNYARKS